ncbi:hypothetical protein [Rhizorhabdus sp.]|uniref:hypothetical protein n=1 Tax=Rhizorhabdus sp. TaxID=1968843 RepID=UPI0019CBA0C2|nr:hypothetical protein [Rhizorhabdus sp.]MBD3759907.1 hypothetical protein [Rhizorhabdus sp.]
MNRFTVLLIAPLAMLAACETTVEVTGMLGVDEALTGSMTHYNDGGTIELNGDPKTHCVGNFSYSRTNAGLRGDGTLVCDDRRMGPFSFILSGARHGHGFGTLNGMAYRFRF